MAFAQVFPTPFFPDVAGAMKIERTTFTALAADAAGTITTRFVRKIDNVKVSAVLTAVINNAVQPPTVALTFNGVTTPTQGFVQIEGV